VRIAVLTLGSQGDVEPFVALAKGLSGAGHDVYVGTGDDFEPLVRRHGLGFTHVGGDMHAMLSTPEGRQLMRSRNPVTAIKRMKQTAARMLATMQDDIMGAMEGADAVVFSYLCGPAIDVVEKTGVPHFLGALQPVLRTGQFPHFAFSNRNLGRVLNRATYDAFQLIMWAFFGRMANTWRKERLDLPPVCRTRRLERLRVPLLGAFSPLLVPKPPDWPDHAWVTGCWHLGANDGWRPPAGLEDFLESGPRPVSIGFGSMLSENVERTTRVVVSALRRSGQRGVLVGGWGGFADFNEEDDQIFAVPFVPYEWLFPRVAAAVHHAGGGTTASAVRAGIPSVPVPFFADQPFWASRMYRLGVSTKAIPHRHLNERNLAEAIRIAAGDADMQRRAREAGETMRKEDGVACAVDIINGALKL
jgi:UDP:flavonoid glycosyltransferase YjiC (YdhE family)